MYVKIAMEILLAFFAVLGLYGSVRHIALKLFGPKNWSIAIEILTQRDAESAEVLIRDALFQCLALPSGRVTVLTVPELCAHPALREALKTYGVSCYIKRDV